MSEELRLLPCSAQDELMCSPVPSFKFAIFSLRPLHQSFVEALIESIQHGAVEFPIVLIPSSQDWITLVGNFG